MKKILIYTLLFGLTHSAHAQKYKTAEDTIKLNKEYMKLIADTVDLKKDLAEAEENVTKYRELSETKDKEAKESAQESSKSASKAKNGDVDDAKKAKKKAEEAYEDAKEADEAKEKMEKEEKKIKKMNKELAKKEERLVDLGKMKETINSLPKLVQ